LIFKKNICVIASSLGGGGAERVASQQTKMLHEMGYNVFVVTLFNNISFQVVGRKLSLGFEKKRGYNVVAKLIAHYKIRRFLRKNNIDIIIDHRGRSSFLNEVLYKFVTYFKIPVIYYVHSYVIENYIPSNNFFTRQTFKRAKRIIAVSNEVARKLKTEYRYENVEVVYNHIDFCNINVNDKSWNTPDFEYVLFYGRIVNEVKNLKLLINSYAQSVLPEYKIKLMIVGEGKDKNMLVNLVDELKLSEMILFKPYTDNPFPVVKQAKYTLLTSKNEGFPMVLIESLACGTPVVSVDCKSGPSEIILNKFNGLLVENNNINALSEAMNSFVLDKELYKHCKLNTKESIFKFNKNSIAKQWLDILK